VRQLIITISPQELPVLMGYVNSAAVSKFNPLVGDIEINNKVIVN